MPTKKKEKPESVKVTIRMYRQGLGDCFLLTFQQGTSRFQMLIDCGVLVGTTNGADLIREVVSDVANETDHHLDVLVVTHEHWDHISGFVQAQDVFDGIQIEQLWVAWTEDPNDPLANELRGSKQKKLKALQLALDKMKSAKYQNLKATILGLTDFYGDLAAAGGKTTGDAWKYILGRKDIQRTFCYPGRSPLSPADFPGVRVYVLGPPQDKTLLKKSDPSKRGKEVYEFLGLSLEDSLLAALDQPAASGEDQDIVAASLPFEPQFQIPSDAALANSYYGSFFSRYSKTDWRNIEEDWLVAAADLALQLDSDTNNTCLVLAIELVASGKVLLFPGDAQVGNWLSWDKYSWQVEDTAGNMRTLTSADLLSRTAFYKVGHHGSHNATLREKGLELMTSGDLVAMIPVERGMAGKKDWNMPFPPLFDRLKEKARGRILRADDDDVPATAREFLTKAELSAFKKAIKITKLYVEYSISV